MEDNGKEEARARFESATRDYDGRINEVIKANERTGEPYYAMLNRGAITPDEYSTIARWSRICGGDI